MEHFSHRTSPMSLDLTASQRPIALVILDGWGYAPRTEGNAIAVAHTPNYDAICRDFPMTTLAASGESVGQPAGERGNADVGHLTLGTGRVAQTEVSRIKSAIPTGAFAENDVLKNAFEKAASNGADIHLVGLISDADIHSSTESLFALLRMAKKIGLPNIYIHCILDGLDVAPRTADVYIEALEIKLADIGVGRIATLCGRYFAMDASDNWERTARAYTMLVHGEGERTTDSVTAIRNSFLRGISDEFISPIILERSPDEPVARIKNGDLVVFFNHRGDTMRQLVRSVAVPDHSAGSKPIVDAVCLTEYDAGLDLPVAFEAETERNALSEVLSTFEMPSFKITESERFRHLTHFFDGGRDTQHQYEQQVLVPAAKNSLRFGQPESESFKIADRLIHGLGSATRGVFVVNLPAVDLMSATGDLGKTVAAIQYIDTCLGGICEKVQQMGGIALITSTHGNCEEMANAVKGEPRPTATCNPVPFHFVDNWANGTRLRDNGTLADISPTILGLLGIDKPAEMTGSDLRVV
jgi:2,3-bisphosphoglycerate-independent phosphoglycerate mutase